MRVNAYILAADPSWIEASVLAYYRHVSRIVVSYDLNSKGWTGEPIDVECCLAKLRAVDIERKMVFSGGSYARAGHAPLENDTYQRQCALNEASAGADWVLQLDTDEVLPRPSELMRTLRELVPPGSAALEWPMRTFFHRAPDGGFLEVCSWLGRQVSAYPGPVAVRVGTKLKHCRQVDGPAWRCDIRKRDSDPAGGGRPVDQVIAGSDAILHFSWVRGEAEIEAKLRSWGHNSDFDWQWYLEAVWRQAPWRWRTMFNIHPLVPRWWPALRKARIALPTPSAQVLPMGGQWPG